MNGKLPLTPSAPALIIVPTLADLIGAGDDDDAPVDGVCPGCGKADGSHRWGCRIHGSQQGRMGVTR